MKKFKKHFLPLLMAASAIFSAMLIYFGGEYWEAKQQQKVQWVVVKQMLVDASAYYKPERNQRIYATGSYAGDIRLNGKGELTASGLVPRIGTVAADTRLFPFGTKLYVPGAGFYDVHDTGADIKGRRIDFFVGAGEEALKIAKAFGRRKILIQIVKPMISG